jgi:hypothetical protein
VQIQPLARGERSPPGSRLEEAWDYIQAIDMSLPRISGLLPVGGPPITPQQMATITFPPTAFRHVPDQLLRTIQMSVSL